MWGPGQKVGVLAVYPPQVPPAQLEGCSGVLGGRSLALLAVFLEYGQKKCQQPGHVPRQRDVAVRGIEAAATGGDVGSAECGTRASLAFGSEEVALVGRSPSAVWP